MATWGPTAIQADANDGCGWAVNGWSSTQPYIGHDAAQTYDAALRWTNVTVPQGSTITSATVTVYAWLSYGTLSNIHTILYGDKADDATTWGTGDVNEQIEETDAHTHFDPTAWVQYDPYEIDATDIVQEIVNRAGWASGQAMRFGLCDNASGGTGDQLIMFYSREQDSDYASTLEIVYTEPESGVTEEPGAGSISSSGAAPSITRKQYGRPSSDVTDGNWTNESSNNTNLYDSVNDIDVDDDTYIRSGETPSGDAVTLGLSSMSTPDAGTVTIRVRARIV